MFLSMAFSVKAGNEYTKLLIFTIDSLLPVNYTIT